MQQRILTALLAAPLAILLTLYAPTVVYAPIIAVIFLAAFWEWTRLSGLSARPLRALLLAGGALLYFVLWQLRDSGLWPWLSVLGLGWWLLSCLWLRHLDFAARPSTGHRLLKLGVGILVLFPSWCAGMGLHHGQPHGHGWTLLVMFLVWGADTGAYFSGRYFGRRKLAPSISPGKTWAGVYGAIGCGALIAAVGGLLLDVPQQQLPALLLLSALTIAASVVGDLLESLIKRQAAVKDSGHLFPGHGGVLDRMDSIFAALPLFALGKSYLGL